MGGSRILRGLCAHVVRDLRETGYKGRVGPIHSNLSNLGANRTFFRVMKSTRIVHHTKQLLDLTAQFPKVNPSSATSSDLDIPRLFRQIRSRYKVLCAALGIRPTLKAGGTWSPPDENEQEVASGDPGPREERKKVWLIDPSRSGRQGGDDLSF